MTLTVERKIAADELKAIRKRLRLTQAQVAERLGVGREAYKNWEYGAAAVPDKYEHAIRALTVEVGPPLIPASQLQIPIPFLGGIAAGAQVNWTDPFESETFEFVPPEMGDPRGRYACRIEGDCMYDLLWPDDICVFQRSDIPKIGAVVMYRCPEDRITIKTLKHDGERFILHPVNPSYEAVPAIGSVVGYLVGIVRVDGSRRITIYDSSGIRGK